MKKSVWFQKLLQACILICFPVNSYTAEISVAVASNFAEPIRELAAQFERKTGDKVTLIVGSTGKHYAQIKNGAPFQAYFAADEKRPRLLEEEGVAIAGSRFTYAIGKILLWSPTKNLVDPQGHILKTGSFRHLAIANPNLAPYGAAAREVLESAKLWDSLTSRMVRGENIGQAFHFVETGNAELGFIAKSQAQKPHAGIAGSWWEVPQNLYTPIEQQAVLLEDNRAAQTFLEFVQGEQAKEIIRQYGYDTP